MTKRTLKKGFETAEGKLVVGIATDCEAKQEYSSYQCGDCNGILAADIFDIDRVGSNERSWDTNDRGDSVVTVYNAVWRRCSIRFPNVLEILWEKGIEKRVTHAYCCPAKPDEACCSFVLATSFSDDPYNLD